MSTQWNRQLSRYVSKVIECLEQNIRKQIDHKKDYQIQNKWTDYKIFELKYGNTKHNQVKLVLQFFFLLICTNIGLNYINQADTISGSKWDNSWYILFRQAFNDKVVITRCLVQYLQIFSSFLIFCCYFTRLKAREISCKIWETRKIFPILHSAPCVHEGGGVGWGGGVEPNKTRLTLYYLYIVYIYIYVYVFSIVFVLNMSMCYLCLVWCLFVILLV